ncbi:MAG: hypothetical protein QW445_01700 [Candidatus Bathyarchaeia archaeon]
MTKQTEKRHKSTPSTKSKLFPPLQRRIILNIAEKDPQTINETGKALKSSYKATWTAFKSLEKKKMIQIVTKKRYRERDYPCYWLTPDGALAAVYEGANSSKILEKSLRIYPTNNNLHLVLEIIPLLGTDVLSIVLGAQLTKGKIEETDITMILASHLNRGWTANESKQFVATLKKYPEHYERLKETTMKARQKLDELMGLETE